ncbi:hypothetical protein KsCSTR_03360 [Candidatus Kuenenia stuttgartiensis]|uniref:Uncharacterized protein n=1 Tax=Kuenenia stuttgartiensis TaxID=174633 RepID=Q1PXX7_KUEST|nr:hypothetical protein KsCSTR_03360 [Candidatus Kuenenia stuttgartiensis]CAJ72896.1 unknown protein [Candidatus Kuenenia stuttgartiensis]
MQRVDSYFRISPLKILQKNAKKLLKHRVSACTTFYVLIFYTGKCFAPPAWMFSLCF